MRRLAPLLLAGVAGCSNCSRGDAASDASTDASTDGGPVNATPLPTKVVQAAVNPKGRPPYDGPTGSVEGTIFVTGDAAPVTDLSPASFAQCADGAKTYGRVFREGVPTEPKGSRWLADAAVAVTGHQAVYVAEREEAEHLSIEGCAFSRRTITMTFGQRLEVKNLSREFWAPQFDPPQSVALMMAPPNGDAVKLYPKKPGRYLLVDHDRHYASADVLVVLQPLHTVSAIEGKYRIDGIPIGKAKLNVWHPRIPLGKASVDIDVQPGVIQKVDLTIDPPLSSSDGGAPDAGKASGDDPFVH